MLNIEVCCDIHMHSQHMQACKAPPHRSTPSSGWNDRSLFPMWFLSRIQDKLLTFCKLYTIILKLNIHRTSSCRIICLNLEFSHNCCRESPHDLGFRCCKRRSCIGTLEKDPLLMPASSFEESCIGTGASGATGLTQCQCYSWHQRTHMVDPFCIS